MPASCATAPRSRARCCSARAYLEIMENGPGFSQLLWDFVDGKPKINTFREHQAGAGGNRIVAQDVEGAVARGFKFVGPTIVYAFMQAVGMVNDHLVTCHRHAEARQQGEALSALRQAAALTASADGAARLAAHAVGAAARSARPLPARHRDRGHRARSRARRALERPDQGRAHLFGRPARAAGRGDGARAQRRGSTPRRGSRCCCTTRRNT